VRSILPEIGGYRLISEQEMEGLPRNTIIFVASRDYFDEIRSQAQDLGFYDIRPFGG